MSDLQASIDLTVSLLLYLLMGQTARDPGMCLVLANKLLGLMMYYKTVSFCAQKPLPIEFLVEC